MKRILFCFLFFAMFLTGAHAQDILGKWKLDDGSAIVEVYKNGEHYNGRIVWLAEPDMPDGTPARDILNPDKNLHSRYILGLDMLDSLEKKGDQYVNGKIYDPGNGKTYFCSVTVKGDVLKVKGSLDKKGLFGRTMDWYREK